MGEAARAVRPCLLVPSPHTNIFETPRFAPPNFSPLLCAVRRAEGEGLTGHTQISNLPNISQTYLNAGDQRPRLSVGRLSRCVTGVGGDERGVGVEGLIQIALWSPHPSLSPIPSLHVVNLRCGSEGGRATADVCDPVGMFATKKERTVFLPKSVSLIYVAESTGVVFVRRLCLEGSASVLTALIFVVIAESASRSRQMGSPPKGQTVNCLGGQKVTPFFPKIC